MPIYFKNPGLIDLRAVTTLGVNVKDSDSPIGFFGTGLKYAISVILREGGSIAIYRGLDRHTFTTHEATIRGTSFSIVQHNDFSNPDDPCIIPLGFTTEFGKKWEPWMAFREVYSNTLDEGGIISETKLAPEADHTLIIVEEPGVTDAWDDRANIFLTSKPILSTKHIEIHAGEVDSYFYRGVRVGGVRSNQTSLFTYNLIDEWELTEDRTLKYSYNAERYIAQAFVESVTDTPMLTKVMLANDGYAESNIDFDWNSFKPSPTFLGLAQGFYLAGNLALNDSIVPLIRRHCNFEKSYTSVPINEIEQQQVTRAITFAKAIGYEVDRYPYIITDDLATGVLAVADRDNMQIILSHQLFSKGTKYVALAFIEEFTHLSLGYQDLTRSLQTYLFEQIISLGERLRGEPI